MRITRSSLPSVAGCVNAPAAGDTGETASSSTPTDSRTRTLRTSRSATSIELPESAKASEAGGKKAKTVRSRCALLSEDIVVPVEKQSTLDEHEEEADDEESIMPLRKRLRSSLSGSTLPVHPVKNDAKKTKSEKNNSFATRKVEVVSPVAAADAADPSDSSSRSQIRNFFQSALPALFEDPISSANDKRSKHPNLGTCLLEHNLVQLLDAGGIPASGRRPTMRSTKTRKLDDLPTALQEWLSPPSNHTAARKVRTAAKRQKPPQPPRPPRPPGAYARDAEKRWAGPPLLEELYTKKTYLCAGLYSSAYKTAMPSQSTSTNSTSTTKAPVLPLPMYYGLTLLSTQVDFTLPFDLFTYANLAPGGVQAVYAQNPQKPPSHFQKISKNIFVDRRPAKCKETAVCHCEIPADGSSACIENCLNRCMMIECNPETCPAAEKCANQRFRNRESVDGIQVVWTSGRGYGLRSTTRIPPSTLVLEYRGEIISQETCLDRMHDMYANLENYYFLNYARGEVIDACRKGTDARFVNHSCEPNCHIEKWMVDGEFAVGLFATKTIEPGQELTYDYRFESFGPMQRCLCGAETCRGFIGVNKKVEVQKPAVPPSTLRNGRKSKRKGNAPTRKTRTATTQPPSAPILPSSLPSYCASPPSESPSSSAASSPARSTATPSQPHPQQQNLSMVQEQQQSQRKTHKGRPYVLEREFWLAKHRQQTLLASYKNVVKNRQLYSTMRMFLVRCVLKGAVGLVPSSLARRMTVTIPSTPTQLVVERPTESLSPAALRLRVTRRKRTLDDLVSDLWTRAACADPRWSSVPDTAEDTEEEDGQAEEEEEDVCREETNEIEIIGLGAAEVGTSDAGAEDELVDMPPPQTPARTEAEGGPSKNEGRVTRASARRKSGECDRDTQKVGERKLAPRCKRGAPTTATTSPTDPPLSDDHDGGESDENQRRAPSRPHRQSTVAHTYSSALHWTRSAASAPSLIPGSPEAAGAAPATKPPTRARQQQQEGPKHEAGGVGTMEVEPRRTSSRFSHVAKRVEEMDARPSSGRGRSGMGASVALRSGMAPIKTNNSNTGEKTRKPTNTTPHTGELPTGSHQNKTVTTILRHTTTTTTTTHITTTTGQDDHRDARHTRSRTAGQAGANTKLGSRKRGRDEHVHEDEEEEEEQNESAGRGGADKRAVNGKPSTKKGQHAGKQEQHPYPHPPDPTTTHPTTLTTTTTRKRKALAQLEQPARPSRLR